MKRLVAFAAFAALAATACAHDRIVSIGGAVTEIVYALGAGSRIVAADSTSIAPDEAKALPRVGYLRALSAEGVLSMKPQLLLAAADAGPGTALTQIRGAGVPVTTLSNGHSLAALKGNVRAIADALGTPRAGAFLEKRLDEDWTLTLAELKAFRDKPKVLFILAHTGTNMMAAGADTAAEAMIRLAGGANAVRGFSNYKPLTAEAAIAAAPDVILITNEGISAIGGEQNLWGRPGLELTPAGARRRLVSMDALYLLGFGPRLPQAVRELAQKLHAK